MKREPCPYCDPYDNQAHFENSGVKIPLSIIHPLKKVAFFLRTKFPNCYHFFKKILLQGFIKIMIGSGVLKEVDILDDDAQLHNRSLVIARAARERGIAMKALKLFGRRETNLFSMAVNNRSILFEGLPLIEVGHVQTVDFDDKFILKQILRNNNLPYAKGEAFYNSKAALRYAKTISFPLVVKPRHGSLSKHTTCDIRSESALKEAIRIAQIIDREFVVEEFISGNVYRITVVRGEMLACCLREPPNVVGDGVHSIGELISMKNSSPLRGDIHQKNFTLHKIRLQGKIVSLLADQGLHFESVLPKGKKVYLHNKVVLGCGADIHDKTDDIHPSNRSIFLKLSRLLGAAIVGIDFVCEDIAKPYDEQRCAIIEANSLPYIDMHHFPVFGQPRDIAGYIVDSVLDIYKFSC
jgi:cyanophycin synthetase